MPWKICEKGLVTASTLIFTFNIFIVVSASANKDWLIDSNDSQDTLSFILFQLLYMRHEISKQFYSIYLFF